MRSDMPYMSMVTPLEQGPAYTLSSASKFKLKIAQQR